MLPPIVCFGEILWDVFLNRATPGGAPLNVAYHLNKLGQPPALISRFGLDEEGRKLIDLVDSYGISTDYFQLDNEWPTGKVLAHVDAHHEVTYDFAHPVAWDYIEWEAGYEAVVHAAPYFVFGSLSTRSAVSRTTLYRLLEASSRRVVDANLRPPHYSRAIIEHLFTGAYLLKLNHAELELVTGWFSPYHTVRDRIRVLQDRFHIPSIVVTNGGKGALFNIDGVLYEHHGFPVQVVDTIGSGDAFLAAMLSALLKKKPPDEALAFANATGALVASKKGGCPAYDTKEIDNLLHFTNLH